MVVLEVSHVIRGPDPKTGREKDFIIFPGPDENKDFIFMDNKRYITAYLQD